LKIKGRLNRLRIKSGGTQTVEEEGGIQKGEGRRRSKDRFPGKGERGGEEFRREGEKKGKGQYTKECTPLERGGVNSNTRVKKNYGKRKKQPRGKKEGGGKRGGKDWKEPQKKQNKSQEGKQTKHGGKKERVSWDKLKLRCPRGGRKDNGEKGRQAHNQGSGMMW